MGIDINKQGSLYTLRISRAEYGALKEAVFNEMGRAPTKAQVMSLEHIFKRLMYLKTDKEVSDEIRDKT